MLLEQECELFFFFFSFVGLLKDKGCKDEIEWFGILRCNYTPAREEQHEILTG